MKTVMYFNPKDRSRTIDRASLIDIGANLLIGLIKVGIATVSGSIAVASDSVLNLGDTLTGILTIIGIKISNRNPTKLHPFGFGRFEYITAVFTSVITLITGFEFARISVEHIFNPVEIRITNLQLVILFSLVGIKYALYLYNRKLGERTDSESLLAASHDSLIDTFGTFFTVLLIFIDRFVKLELDGYIGLAVAVCVMVISVRDIIKMISILLGTEPSKSLIEGIKRTVLEEKSITGVENILIHSYGYNVKIGQMRIKLPMGMEISQATEIISKIRQELKEKYDIDFIVGVYCKENKNTSLNS